MTETGGIGCAGITKPGACVSTDPNHREVLEENGVITTQPRNLTRPALRGANMDGQAAGALPLEPLNAIMASGFTGRPQPPPPDSRLCD